MTTPKAWPFGDLAPGTYTVAAIAGDTTGAVITDDGRLLVEQFDPPNRQIWSDLTDVYHPSIEWKFTKREPVYRSDRAVEQARAEATERFARLLRANGLWPGRWEDCTAIQQAAYREQAAPYSAAVADLLLSVELSDVRDQLVAKLDKHRATSTRCDGDYKNPVRKGYDRALTEVLGLLGVDATEAHDHAAPEPFAHPASPATQTRDEVAADIRQRYGLPAADSLSPLSTMRSMLVESVVAQSQLDSSPGADQRAPEPPARRAALDDRAGRGHHESTT